MATRNCTESRGRKPRSKKAPASKPRRKTSARSLESSIMHACDSMARRTLSSDLEPAGVSKLTEIARKASELKKMIEAVAIQTGDVDALPHSANPRVRQANGYRDCCVTFVIAEPGCDEEKYDAIFQVGPDHAGPGERRRREAEIARLYGVDGDYVSILEEDMDAHRVSNVRAEIIRSKWRVIDGGLSKAGAAPEANPQAA